MKRPLFVAQKFLLLLLLARHTAPKAVEASAVFVPRWLPLRKNQGRLLESLRGGGGGAADVLLRTEKRVIPSLFSEEDEGAMEYDAYAACLAATEGLRRIRDRQRLVDPVAARRQFVRDSKTVLDTMGMTIEKFNSIGAHVASDEELKEKVRDFISLLHHIGDLSAPLSQHNLVLLFMFPFKNKR